jgi:hypothetical protein
MRRKMILALGLSVLAMVVVVAAGCGGDSDKTAAATTEEVATTEATTTEEAVTTEEATTTEEAVTTEATTTESGDDLSGLTSAGNCKALAELGQKFSAALSGAASSQDLKKEAVLLKEFASKTPADIRPDFEVYADFVGKVADAYDGITPGQTPTPAQIAALQKLSTEIDQAKLTAASQHIATWTTQNCHA